MAHSDGNNFSFIWITIDFNTKPSWPVYLYIVLISTSHFLKKQMNEVVPSYLAQYINIFMCPSCGGVLEISGNQHNIECSDCNTSFQCDQGIPLLFWPNMWDSQEDVTEIEKSFYEDNPFPGYEDLDSQSSLREKAEKGVFARLLDDQIPHEGMVLEAGCGTGQLSNFLGMTWGRNIFATDICLNSLKLGQEFKLENQIENVAFIQMNLFKPVFRSETFDLVISNGVLHHTSNPFNGFKSILKLVKKGGFIVVGLYNTYGRITTDIRRSIFRQSGNRLKFLDPRFRDKDLSEKRKQTWFADQYKNPHESKHTIGEVLNWFDQTGVEFTNSIPKAIAFESFSPAEELFKVNPRGTKFDHFLVQLGMLLGGGKEGGFFIMIGQKKESI